MKAIVRTWPQYLRVGMTIKIPENIASEFVLKLAEGFQSNCIKYDFIILSDLRWSEELEAILPEDAREKLERFVGEGGLPKLILSEIDNDRDRLEDYEELEAGQRLSDISFINNTISYAKNIVEVIRSLPRRYSITAKMPTTLSGPVFDILPDKVNLPEGIKIRKGSSISKNIPINSSHDLIDISLFRNWSKEDKIDRKICDDALYFSMPLIGYAAVSSSSVLGREFEDNLRAFYGVGMAIGLFSYSYSTEGQKMPYMMGHSIDEKEILFTEELEDDLLDRHSLLATSDFIKRTENNQKKFLLDNLSQMGTVFLNNKDCRKLFLACVWYYKSMVNRRLLDSVLQATIAIEVMLGDRKAAEGVGLTNMLASRCAYLLGTSSEHRREIEEKFKKVYDFRSQIVHEGRHTLKIADRKTISIAKGLCAAIIRKELRIRAVAKND
ncbi:MULTISPECIES: HEPN domain-containing protein [unclassified Sphingomonas]|uniref:HEPN domain-containing protein n=1 Tax=unclassified Sphingomonas TaxID=196159 RepID=UPI0012E0D243|nr:MULTISPECIES: HEPN domain-containing protein [unclassified Sphingomonas]